MDFINSFKKALFSCSENDLEAKALTLFRYQARHNPVYRAYIRSLGVSATAVQHIIDIPFLPISFFKTHPVLTTGSPQKGTCFESSGTTGQVTSKHYVQDPAWYLQNAQHIFESLYGPLSDYVLLALLPSYLERNNASLVYMVQHFIEQTQHPDSGFFLNNHETLLRAIERSKKSSRKVLLFGATFALLDFTEQTKPDLSDCLVIETGGMKGRREEITREELHQLLHKNGNHPDIHAEYGMTELLSQTYATDGFTFTTPPWMRILLRDTTDPFHLGVKRGGINIIDLANTDSCAFIETSDIGEMSGKGFRVLGRIDNADMRGCSLLTA